MEPKHIARWICDILLGELKYRKKRITDVEPWRFSQFLWLVDTGLFTDRQARTILREYLDKGYLYYGGPL